MKKNKTIWDWVKPSGKLFNYSVLLFMGLLLVLGYQGHLEGIQALLDSPKLTLDLQGIRVSPYSILKISLTIVFMIWLASMMSSMISGSILKMKKVRASNRVLFSKIAQILVYIFIFFVAMDVLNIDITALTVFSGAIGIGIGFGFQKIASNFISGLIILSERSIEVDDLIELDDGTTGFIRKTGGRYSLIETFDGREVLIPNEDLITTRVINWTYTSKKGRAELNIGVGYGSDYRLAQKLILEAVDENPLCTKDPAPQCVMTGFGDSSVNFLLYFWVDDVVQGRNQPKSEVLFAIADKFDKAGISIPFPQRDIHIKDGSGGLKL